MRGTWNTFALLCIGPRRGVDNDRTTTVEETKKSSEMWHHKAPPVEPPRRPMRDGLSDQWAGWLHIPCHLGGPQCFNAREWRTSRPGGYISPAALGYPTLWSGGKSYVAHKWASWPRTPAALGVPNASQRGTKSAVAQKWDESLNIPCCMGGPQCFIAVDNITGGP